MKFEYDKNEDERECVAYIDGDGDLVVRDIDGDCVSVGNAFCYIATWDQSEAIHKFYPGDKITITF